MKIDKEDVIGFLSDMIDALTWRNVGLLALLGAALIVLLISFENRTILFNRLFESKPIEAIVAPWELSDVSKQELLKLSNSQSIIGGFLVTEVDLKKNRRITKFWYVEDPSFKDTAAKVVANLLPQAFFDTDAKNNDQMLSVLNNQFSCVQTSETIYMRFFPDMPKTYPYLCRLAVPPFSGEFAGLITLFLVRQPTASDVEALKIELTRISIDLYLRDIERRSSN